MNVTKRRVTMDDRQRKMILNLLNAAGTNEQQMIQAAADAAKTTKILLDAFEREGIAHNDAMAIICSIMANASGDRE